MASFEQTKKFSSESEVSNTDNRASIASCWENAAACAIVILLAVVKQSVPSSESPLQPAVSKYWIYIASAVCISTYIQVSD